MECLPTNSLLEFHPNTLLSIRKTHGLDAPGQMKELVDEFEEWVKNQDHFVKKDFSTLTANVNTDDTVQFSFVSLPENMLQSIVWKQWEKDTSERLKLSLHQDNTDEVFAKIKEEYPKYVDHVHLKRVQSAEFEKDKKTRHYLETIIINSKGSLDKAKTRLTRICSYRTEKPYYFGNYDIKNDFKEFDGVIHVAILPKLTKDHCRMIFIKNSCKKYQSDVIVQFLRMAIMILDYMKCHDYSDGVIFIVDLMDCSLLQLIRRLSFEELRKAEKILIDAYGVRLKGVHFISSLRTINFLIWMLKKVVSIKIGSRLCAHPNIKSLADVMPLEILPIEYGGNERSLESLSNDCVNIMASQEFRSHMIEMTNARLKETIEETDNKPEKIRNVNID
ncbi:uncharacterized protein LOC113231874 [Hyposmocoma kahamanoa]|uniref:uncharacterized protein LOC113231874 n=1 Tax=Hyposmocoma kahamanoa TaxID=1477025 RepID=UPI000E6D7E27|nr:uncharacterized protein LOC113231874 [Hyposmocoma kahamanoa]